MAPRLILASQSQVRASLLKNAGVPFEIEPAHIDEEEIKQSLGAEGASAAHVAEVLAEMKALKVSRRDRDALVLGADQVLDCDGKLFDKPTDMQGVEGHLKFMRGKTHTLATAIAIARGEQIIWRHQESPKLSMRPLSDEYINQYKERNGEKLMSSVGAYFLEEEGAQLFDKIEGDFFAILGLPLIPVLDLLRRYEILSL